MRIWAIEPLSTSVFYLLKKPNIFQRIPWILFHYDLYDSSLKQTLLLKFHDEEIKAQRESNVILALNRIDRMEVFWPQELSFFTIIISVPTKQTALQMKLSMV